MSKRQLLILLAIWIALYPFLGFPSEWNKVTAIIHAGILLIVAYKMRPRQTEMSDGQATYIEHRNTEEAPTQVAPRRMEDINIKPSSEKQ